MKRIGRVIVFIMVAALTVVALETVANAGIDELSEVTGSRVNFYHSGDKFRVCDTSWDGWNAYVDYEYLRINGTLQTGAHFINTGDGTCGTFAHNFGEGRIVNFRACVEIWPWPDICDDWQQGVA